MGTVGGWQGGVPACRRHDRADAGVAVARGGQHVAYVPNYSAGGGQVVPLRETVGQLEGQHGAGPGVAERHVGQHVADALLQVLARPCTHTAHDKGRDGGGRRRRARVEGRNAQQQHQRVAVQEEAVESDAHLVADVLHTDLAAVVRRRSRSGGPGIPSARTHVVKVIGAAMQCDWLSELANTREERAWGR